MPAFRILMSTVTAVGLVMLFLVFLDWQAGLLAPKHFPGADHDIRHHAGGLLLSLPIPLHVIFIGLIMQKRWLSPGMARFAWVGIVTSGLWLGASLLYRMIG